MFEILQEAEFTLRSTPELIAEIRAEEREISRRRARQVRLLRELQARSVTGADPSPTKLAAELDVDTQTARALLETASRTPELSERFGRLESGNHTFDRANALARLFGEGADEATMEEAAGRDLAGIHRLRAMTKRIRRRDERQAHEERHVRSWPSLDESVGFITPSSVVTAGR